MGRGGFTKCSSCFSGERAVRPTNLHKRAMTVTVSGVSAIPASSRRATVVVFKAARFLPTVSTRSIAAKAGVVSQASRRSTIANVWMMALRGISCQMILCKDQRSLGGMVMGMGITIHGSRNIATRRF